MNKQKKSYFDISFEAMLLLGLMAVIFKLLLSYTQYVTIYPPLAPLDDDLMFKAAQSISQGTWLGAYNYLTISKHLFFSLWLAFLHAFKIPYLVGNMALWALASLALTAAFSPVIKRNWAKLFLFCGLLYNPATSAQFSTRIYRDSIFPALCVFFFAGLIAVAFRHKKPLKALLPWLFLYGTAFGCIYLCREDGLWLASFGVVAITITGFLMLKASQEKAKENGKPLSFAKKISKPVSLILPFILSGLIICAYCYMNYVYYGRFIVSDFTSGEFKSAYGALTSLKQENWQPMVAVPSDVREKAYNEVPSFAPVKEALKAPLLENGFKSEKLGDFASGSFYWALRTALNDLGEYETPQKAQNYYENLTAQIQKAVDEGRLETQNGSFKLRKSVTPPIKMQYVPAVFAEGMKGFKTALLFEQCDPLAQMAVGEKSEIENIENFIHQKGATATVENTAQMFLSTPRKLSHGFLNIMIWAYKICIPLMFVITLFWQVKQLRVDIWDKKFTHESLLNIILAGLLAMSLLRCAMIAFMEVSSFGIGTYAMYLSTVHPLLIAYSFMGFVKTFEY